MTVDGAFIRSYVLTVVLLLAYYVGECKSGKDDILESPIPRYWPPWKDISVGNKIDSRHTWEKNKRLPQITRDYIELGFVDADPDEGCADAPSDAFYPYIQPVYFWSYNRLELPCKICRRFRSSGGDRRIWKVLPGGKDMMERIIHHKLKIQSAGADKRWMDLGQFERDIARSYMPFPLPFTSDKEEKPMPPLPRFYQRNGKLIITNPNPSIMGLYYCYDDKAVYMNAVFLMYVVMPMTPYVETRLMNPLGGDHKGACNEDPYCCYPSDKELNNEGYNLPPDFPSINQQCLKWFERLNPNVDTGVNTFQFGSFDPTYQWRIIPSLKAMKNSVSMEERAYFDSRLEHQPYPNDYDEIKSWWWHYEKNKEVKDDTRYDGRFPDHQKVILGRRHRWDAEAKTDMKIVKEFEVNAAIQFKWSEWSPCSACAPYRGVKVREGHCLLTQKTPNISKSEFYTKTYKWDGDNLNTHFHVGGFEYLASWADIYHNPPSKQPSTLAQFHLRMHGGLLAWLMGADVPSAGQQIDGSFPRHNFYYCDLRSAIERLTNVVVTELVSFFDLLPHRYVKAAHGYAGIFDAIGTNSHCKDMYNWNYNFPNITTGNVKGILWEHTQNSHPTNQGPMCYDAVFHGKKRLIIGGYYYDIADCSDPNCTPDTIKKLSDFHW